MKVRFQRKQISRSNKICPVCKAPYLLAESKGKNRDLYDWYINHSPVWYAKRQWALQRANHSCEQCGKTYMLSVHHLNYNNLGMEHPEDLKVLCQECHERAHGIGERWEICN